MSCKKKQIVSYISKEDYSSLVLLEGIAKGYPSNKKKLNPEGRIRKPIHIENGCLNGHCDQWGKDT